MSDFTSFTDDLLDMLESYTGNVADGVKKLADKTMKEFVEATKQDAPERTGDYKNAITSKTLAETRFTKVKVWYVKPPYHSLAHLLEDGHVKQNGGRVKARPHIRKNAEKAIKKFEEGTEEIIKNAGK